MRLDLPFTDGVKVQIFHQKTQFTLHIHLSHLKIAANLWFII